MHVDLVSLIFGGGGVAAIVAAVMLIPNVRKTNAETDQSSSTAAKTIADTALELLTPLREEAAQARKEAQSAREQNVALRVEFAEFRDEVRVLREELAEYHRRYGPLTA